MRFGHLAMDAADQLFFERELLSVKAKSYDIKLPALMARTLIPVSNEEDPGAESVKYEQYSMTGLAKIIANYADDLPSADAKGKEYFATIKGLASSFRYSIQEIRAAMMAKKPLEQRKANAAMRAIEQEIDRIGASGDAANNLVGLLNITNAGVYTVPAGDLTTKTWATKTADEILKDLNGIIRKMRDDTNGVEVPDTIVLPEAQYDLIATMPRATGTDTTVLEFFLRVHPGMQVLRWYRLKGAGDAGADRMLCYRRDPDVLQLVIPVEAEQLPPQQKGLTFQVPVHARCGGVICFYPLAVMYGDGI